MRINGVHKQPHSASVEYPFIPLSIRFNVYSFVFCMFMPCLLTLSRNPVSLQDIETVTSQERKGASQITEACLGQNQGPDSTRSTENEGTP